LRISEKCGRPINGILSDTTSAFKFTDQPRLCCRKHRNLQHHCRVQVFEQWSTSNPAFADRDDTVQVPPAPLSPLLRYHNDLLSALFWPFHGLVRSPFRKKLPLPARFWSSGDFLSQTTVVRSFLRQTSVQTFFGRLQHGRHMFTLFKSCVDLRETFITTFTFSVVVYFC